MSTALATQQPGASALEKVLLQGDLSALTSEQRITYYRELCASLDLNPLTKPFEYLELKGPGGKVSLTLYTKKDCTDQLRNKRNVSCKIVSRETVEGVYIVTARASTPEGREEESIGAVPIQKEGGRWTTDNGQKRFEADGTFIPLRPEERANAMMKAETKAKRRATLSLFGLGFSDESEIDQIRGASTVSVDGSGSGRLLEADEGDSKVQSSAAPVATANRPIPEELELAIGGVRRGDFSMLKGVTETLQAECESAGLGKRFKDMSSGLRASFPKGTLIPAATMEAFLLGIWDAIQAAKPKAEVSIEDKSGWIPEGVFGEDKDATK